MEEMKKYLGPDSKVAQIVENYEYRSEQVQMADKVSEAIEKEQNLLVEAGTGIGKSFAYLVPFMLWAAAEKDRRVAVSTYTKTLQEQLLKKDIPLLQKIMPGKIKALLCVGSNNYICLLRFNKTFSGRMTDTKKEAEQLEKTARWLDKTKTGLKMEIDFTISPELWTDISRDPALCRERSCPFHGKCYFYRSRRDLSKADLLIVNHHLFLTDVASGGHVLPASKAVIFDEAHNLEDIASDTLGLTVSLLGIKQLLGKIHSSRSSRCLTARASIENSEKRKIIEKVRKTLQQASLFFSSVIDELGAESSLSYRIHSPGLFENTLSPHLVNLAECLDLSAGMCGDDSLANEFRSYSSRLKMTAETLKNIIFTELENYVFYITIRIKKGRVFCSFNATPVEVSSLLKELVFKPYTPTVMTSATLTVGHSFEFIKSRTGMTDAMQVRLESPFDYSDRVLFYIPDSMPDPSLDMKIFEREAVEQTASIIEITSGRTFVLFTSYGMLDFAAEQLSGRFPDLNFLVQGRMPRYKLLDSFKKNESSVLLGTSTFWQGVDAPGRILECVIITKLPFAVPDNPVIESRMELLKKKGLNPFWDYQIPSASLLFKQGFGRLIRHRNDFGIVAVLDPRLRDRQYGRIFISSLPECIYVSGIDELHEEYERLCRKYAT